jgi:phospholipid/cholesterol/gamma-HCH transport system ATP-binding protein
MSPSSSAPHEPLVELRKVHVRFGLLAVLRDISLKVRPGETLAVIGESGCGKTVMLKAMIGLVTPTVGHVLFSGQDLAKLNDAELARQRTRYGFVFQQAALFDSMTIGQNVAFPLRQHRQLKGDEIRDIVLDRLADVGLPESVVYQWPAELSGGMRKRVGLARALVLDPEIILYDEPTTGLDPIMSDVINKLIVQTRARGNVTSVVVTHDMKTAYEVADRIIMLFPLAPLGTDEEQIIFEGTPDEMRQCEDHRVSQFVRGEAGERLTTRVSSKVANRT